MAQDLLFSPSLRWGLQYCWSATCVSSCHCWRELLCRNVLFFVLNIAYFLWGFCVQCVVTCKYLLLHYFTCSVFVERFSYYGHSHIIIYHMYVYYSLCVANISGHSSLITYHRFVVLTLMRGIASEIQICERKATQATQNLRTKNSYFLATILPT